MGISDTKISDWQKIFYNNCVGGVSLRTDPLNIVAENLENSRTTLSHSNLSQKHSRINIQSDDELGITYLDIFFNSDMCLKFLDNFRGKEKE